MTLLLPLITADVIFDTHCIHYLHYYYILLILLLLPLIFSLIITYYYIILLYWYHLLFITDTILITLLLHYGHYYIINIDNTNTLTVIIADIAITHCYIIDIDFSLIFIFLIDIAIDTFTADAIDWYFTWLLPLLPHCRRYNMAMIFMSHIRLMAIFHYFIIIIARLFINIINIINRLPLLPHYWYL